MDVTQGELAERMGVSAPKLSRWENSRKRLPPAKVEQYLAGLATFGTIPTVDVRAA